MKLYRITKREGQILTSLSIDPGVSTAGFCLLGTRGRLETWSAASPDFHVLKLIYPELLVKIRDRALEFINKTPICGAQWETTEVIMEYPHISGGFSLGLAQMITTLTQIFIDKLNVPRVVFIPNRIPEFFLKVRSVSGRETVDLVKSFGILEGRFPVHEADALLFSVFAHLEVYRSRYPSDAMRNLRVPNFEIVELQPWK